MSLVLCCIILFVLYALLILYFTQGWQAVPVFEKKTDAPVHITVVIPARNEAQHIGPLLEALQQQTHPAAFTEIIVADDESTDDTAAIVQRFPNVRLLQVRPSAQETAHKKFAVASAVATAAGEYIVCTDADCLPGPAWLATLSAFIRTTGAFFVAAPVRFTNSNRLSGIFQSLDFMTLQGITGAAVFRGSLAMSNGANLAYAKKTFDAVHGFEGIDHIASGDDMLLMQKIKEQWPDKVHYLRSKEAIIETAPMPDWRSFFNQRIRWASKATAYRDPKIKAVLLLVYLFNLSFIVLAVASVIHPEYLWWLAGLWIGKTLIELPFMIDVARFFEQQKLLRYFFLFQPLHILYTVASGFFGVWKKYEWKGRRVR